jgi:hypothetical protein
MAAFPQTLVTCLYHLDTVDQLSFTSLTVTFYSEKFLSCVLHFATEFHTNASLMMSLKNCQYTLVLNQLSLLDNEMCYDCMENSNMIQTVY